LPAVATDMGEDTDDVAAGMTSQELGGRIFRVIEQ